MMNIQTFYDTVRPRHRVWCLSEDLTAGESAETYTSTEDHAPGVPLGDGSEIIVMDAPGRLLYWDAENECGYDWSAVAGAEEATT